MQMKTGGRTANEEVCGVELGVSRKAQEDFTHEDDCYDVIGMGCGIQRDGVEERVFRVVGAVHDFHYGRWRVRALPFVEVAD